ncbi:zinc-dependent metalloprotease [Pedobacter nyackensis]|uniref:zinc-dependent metalloprotease n=1 Tax=Pedobacter nyackensis TaxID=475255 RepID=UPI002931802E|nr:zinc-dependent metalloprotease [Pedobacter nyackensis]
MKIKTCSKLLLIGLMTFTSFFATAQKRKSKKSKMALTDTTKAVVRPKINPNKKIKSYESVVNKSFNSKKGLFSVHRYRDTIYFEIPDSLLKRDILVINRLKKSPAGSGMYAGEMLDENLINFELGPDSSIRVRLKLIVDEADPGSNISKAVRAATLDPMIATFPIKAYAKDSSSYVIDMSKFLTEMNFINSIGPSAEILKKISASPLKDVEIESVHVYPLNVELALSKNLPGKSVVAGVSTASIETNTSFIVLPKVPMQRRYADKRVGYFSRFFNVFADDQHRAESKSFISRWRLEPKDEDIEKWKRGELVEAKKPIVIYIDPATPKQWVPFLIDGINDWQGAFEKAGFKNAIVGKAWPENDSTMQIDDARYSVLNYLPSNIPNAYGPHVADPRSGEIIQTHIGWYHNIMDLLNRWYFTQASAVDPQARKAKFDGNLMGELIRFVSSHEVGHTLGLRHNFGSSSKTPVDSLRNLNYLKKNGHTASIMDYARFNYVAQPEDHIPQKYLFPRVGDYDEWAIEWGYKSSFAANADEDNKIVKEWIVKRVGANPRLWYGDGEGIGGDPRTQTEDLGDNAAKASTYGIKNLKRIVPNLKTWSYEKGGTYENLLIYHTEIITQYNRYLGHVMKNVGAFHRTVRNEDEKLPAFNAVPRKLQLEAMAFFDREVFTTPLWLINSGMEKYDMDPAYLPKDNPTGRHTVENLQIRTLNTLLKDGMLQQIEKNAKRFGKGTYSLDDHMNALRRSIWKDLNAGQIKMDSYRRNLQKSYVGALIEIVTFKNVETAETDVPSIIKAELKNLRVKIQNSIPKTNDKLTKYHLIDLKERIDKALYIKG